MKKVYLKVAMVAVVAAVVGMGIYSSQKADVASDIALANVEALAQGEGGIGGKYQTMGYCTPWSMDYKCQYQYTNIPCYRDSGSCVSYINFA